MPPVAAPPAEALQALLLRVVGGDAASWRKLQEQILPSLEGWARSHKGLRRRKLQHSEDDLREVVVLTLERLQANDFRSLRSYLDSSEQVAHSAFDGWLYGALDFAVREHLRARFGRLRTRKGNEETPIPSKRDVNTLASRFDDDAAAPASRMGVTLAITLQEILGYADANFSPRDAQALRAYIEQGANYEQLSERFELENALEAERLIRKLKERLRTHFGPLD